MAAVTCWSPSQNNLTAVSEQPGYPFPWAPCSNFTSSDGFVPCCQTDFTVCLPNRACQITAQGYPQQLIRAGCTDPTFKSANCPQFMLNSGDGNNRNYFKSCGNHLGCFNLNPAAANSSDCQCTSGAPNLLVIQDSTIYPLSSTSTSSSSLSLSIPSSPTTSGSLISTLSTTTSSNPSATASLSASTNPTSAAANTPAPNGPNLGVIVGASVGVVAGLAIIGAISFFIWRRRRNQGKGTNQPPKMRPWEKNYGNPTTNGPGLVMD